MKSKTEATFTSILTIGIVQFFAGLILIISLLNNARGLIYLALLTLITVNGSRLWSRLSLYRLQMESRLQSCRLFSGDELRWKARVINAKIFPARIKLKISLPDLFKREITTAEFTRSCDLLWYQEVSWEPVFRVEKRGVYEIAPIEIEGIDLLGFFTRTRRFPGSNERLVVYPRLTPVRDSFIPTAEFFGSKIRRGPVEDPLYLVGVSDYRQDRPAKNIHWKASARHHRLLEKLFESTAETKVLIIVNAMEYVKHNAVDGWERTLEVAASLAVNLIQGGAAVGLITNGSMASGCLSFVPLGRNQFNLETLLESLAGLKLGATESITEAVRHYPIEGATNGVYFSYIPEELDLSLRSLLQLQYRLPTIAVFASETPGESLGPGSFVLSDLCIPEEVADDRHQ